MLFSKPVNCCTPPTPVPLPSSAKTGSLGASSLSGVAGLYGAVRLRENKLLVVTGPFVNKPLDDAVFDALIHDYGLLWEQKDALKQFLLSLPRRSLNVFLNFLALLDFLFNGEEISILRYFENFAPAIRQEMGEKHTDAILREEEFTHGTYAIEQQLLSYVSAGDETGLKAFLQEIAGKQVLFEGKLADDTLRQSKNIFNGWISMVGKVGAIRGNLDIEQTYRLIDLYTQECERCTTVSEVNNLRYSSLMDFTRRVAELKHPAAYSEDVYKALQFIKTHTNQPIGVPDVLEYVGKSRSYFMEQFKKETGETIGKYIVKAKLQVPTAPFRKFPTFSSFPANPTFRTCSRRSSASRPSNTEKNTIKNERPQLLIFYKKVDFTLSAGCLTGFPLHLLLS